jgi:hypothetical protein
MSAQSYVASDDIRLTTSPHVGHTASLQSAGTGISRPHLGQRTSSSVSAMGVGTGPGRACRP